MTATRLRRTIARSAVVAATIGGGLLLTAGSASAAAPAAHSSAQVLTGDTDVLATWFRIDDVSVKVVEATATHRPNGPGSVAWDGKDQTFLRGVPLRGVPLRGVPLRGVPLRGLALEVGIDSVKVRIDGRIPD